MEHKQIFIIGSLVIIFSIGGIGIFVTLPESMMVKSMLNDEPVYYDGIGIIRYSENEIQKLEKQYEGELLITVISDEELKNVSGLKIIIEKALSMEYPLNDIGKTSITFKELDKFQKQYAEILSEKYSKLSTEFFSTTKHLGGGYLTTTIYVRTFEARYFEYDGKQYRLIPDSIILSIDDGYYIGVSQVSRTLPENDLIWADITEKQIDVKHIIDAIDDIGQHEENIKIRVGLPITTIIEYREWYVNTVENNLFEYDEYIFSMFSWSA